MCHNKRRGGGGVIHWFQLNNGGLEKFWPNLEISKAFEMGLEVSFSGDFASCSDPVTNSYGESWDSSCEKL